MTEYYYLNSHNLPQGPHTLDQLAELMACGRINPTTLVACKGGSSWEPLGSVLSRENITPPELRLQPGQVGNCPSCGHDLTPDLKDAQLPTTCPACGRTLWSGKPGIHFWDNFCLAFHNYAKFTGRATRAEFWCFHFINLLIMLAVYCLLITGAIITAVTEMADNESSSALTWGFGTAFIVIAAVALIGWAFFSFIPQLSLTVRRLHDVGWSGKWLIPYFILCTVPQMIAIPLENSAKPDVEHLLSDTLFLCMLISLVAAYAFGIFLFVLTLLDSKRGANAYGPSSKYPLG